MITLEQLLHQHFPTAVFADDAHLGIGSFAEWTSLAHFNFLLLVEETYAVRFSLDEMSEMKDLQGIRMRLSATGITA
jgi:acyl carrier protein